MGYKLTWMYIWQTKVRPSGIERKGDMDNWALAQTSSALSWTWWGWISMNPDGTKLYLSQWTYAREYSLWTAYDISSIPSPTYTLSIWSAIEDLCFSPDGTKLYIVYWDWVSVRKYDLSTAWDLSTAVYNQELNTPSPNWTRWLYVTPDWTKIFISSHQSYSKSWMCTLSTAWDLSTASSWTQTLSNGWVSCCFGDNWKLYFTQINESTSNLTYMTLSTEYDLSTVTSTDTKNIGRMRAWGIWFKADWTICMMVWWGSSTNYVTKYTL